MLTIQQAIERREQRAAFGWQPACGGTETPFRSRSGRVLLYMWNHVTGEHAYYAVNDDVFLTNEEAAQAMGQQ